MTNSKQALYWCGCTPQPDFFEPGELRLHIDVNCGHLIKLPAGVSSKMKPEQIAGLFRAVVLYLKQIGFKPDPGTQAAEWLESEGWL